MKAMLKKNLARYHTLTPTESRTFRLHIAYSIIEGIIAGVVILNDFILLKSLQGTKVQVAFLVQSASIVLLASVVFNEMLNRSRNRKKLLLWVAIMFRGPLVFLAMFPQSYEQLGNPVIWQHSFLIILFMYYLAQPMMLPTISLFLKNIYRHEYFGQLYGFATMTNKIVMLVVTAVFGIALDADHFAFTKIYPALGLAGILSIYLISRIPYVSATAANIKLAQWQSVKNLVFEMIHILKTNAPFRDMQIGFMLYGIAFLLAEAMLSLFLLNILNCNFTTVAFYKNSYNILAILLLPFFSRLIGKLDPRRFGVFTFASLGLFYFFFMLTEYFPYHFQIGDIAIYPMLLLSYVFHGIFAATMSLLWFIGSAYFCKPTEAGTYQAVHTSLTGVRAIFAPHMGVFFLAYISYTGVFVIAILFLLSAILVLLASMKLKKVIIS